MADQTVQIEGTGSFGVKFTTPYDKDFDDTSYQQGDGFKCYISLPSKTRNVIMFWYDINKSYEQETTGNVTGFGVFENKTRDNNNNIIFNIVIPVITDEFLIPDNIYIMLGLEKDTDINITDIELTTPTLSSSTTITKSYSKSTTQDIYQLKISNHCLLHR